MKQRLAPWLPAIFCAFLSVFPLIALVVPYGPWWQPAYYCFLPLCFYYACVAQKDTNRGIEELRARLVALEANQAG